MKKPSNLPPGCTDADIEAQIADDGETHHDITTATPRRDLARQGPMAIDTNALAQQAIALGDGAVDALERVLALAERERDYQARCAYNDAMLAVQTCLPQVYKDGSNPDNRSRYARLESIDRAVRPVYTRHGFRITYSTEPLTEPAGWIMHVATVSHAGGHVETIRMPLPIDNKGPKGGPTKTEMHGVGSALSYAQRRLLCLAFGVVVTGEDNDGVPPPDPTPVTAEQANWIRSMAAEVYPRDEQRAAFLGKFHVKQYEEIPGRFYPQIQSMMEQRKRFIAEHPEVAP